MVVRILVELVEPGGAVLAGVRDLSFEWQDAARASEAAELALAVLDARLKDLGKLLADVDRAPLRSGLISWLGRNQRSVRNGEILRVGRAFGYSCVAPIGPSSSPRAPPPPRGEGAPPRPYPRGADAAAEKTSNADGREAQLPAATGNFGAKVR